MLPRGYNGYLDLLAYFRIFFCARHTLRMRISSNYYTHALQDQDYTDNNQNANRLAWAMVTTTQILPTKSKECNNRTHLCRLPHGAHSNSQCRQLPTNRHVARLRNEMGEVGTRKWERGHKLRHSLPRVWVRYEYELLLTLAAG